MVLSNRLLWLLRLKYQSPKACWSFFPCNITPCTQTSQHGTSSMQWSYLPLGHTVLQAGGSEHPICALSAIINHMLCQAARNSAPNVVPKRRFFRVCDTGGTPSRLRGTLATRKHLVSLRCTATALSNRGKWPEEGQWREAALTSAVFSEINMRVVEYAYTTGGELQHHSAPSFCPSQ